MKGTPTEVNTTDDAWDELWRRLRDQFIRDRGCNDPDFYVREALDKYIEAKIRQALANVKFS